MSVRTYERYEYRLIQSTHFREKRWRKKPNDSRKLTICLATRKMALSPRRLSKKKKLWIRLSSLTCWLVDWLTYSRSFVRTFSFLFFSFASSIARLPHFYDVSTVSNSSKRHLTVVPNITAMIKRWGFTSLTLRHIPPEERRIDEAKNTICFLDFV